jgi:hypothetical protein
MAIPLIWKATSFTKEEKLWKTPVQFLHKMVKVLCKTANISEICQYNEYTVPTADIVIGGPSTIIHSSMRNSKNKDGPPTLPMSTKPSTSSAPKKRGRPPQKKTIAAKKP